MNFIAMDVETANADLSSICQVGIAYFENGELTDTWYSLIDPEDEFSPLNTSIHGIDEASVRGLPTWPEVYSEIKSRLDHRITICHTHFDRSAVTKACERYGLDPVNCMWLDSARLARRAWTEFARCGYGLANLAKHFGIHYQAHDALEDARCAGLIVLRAVAETGVKLDDWLNRVNKPIFSLQKLDELSRESNESTQVGEWTGEVVVFTGELAIRRWEAAQQAKRLGARIDRNISKETTILVIGDQDVRKLAGHEESTKQRKAAELIRKGRNVRLISGSDFLKSLSLDSKDQQDMSFA